MKKLIVLLLLLAAASAFAQGGGFRPKFIIQPTSLQFGTVTDSLDKLFTIRVDTAQHSDVNVSLSSPNTSVFRIIGSMSFTVTQGTTDTVRIRFKPTGGQLFRDTIWATHNGDTTLNKNPTRITMSGSGPDTLVHITIGSQLIFFPATTVGQTSNQVVAIKNTSFVQKQLTGSSAIAKTPTPYAITSGGTFSLAQNATDSLRLSFTPTTGGQAIDTLLVTSNAGATGSTISKIIIFGAGMVPDTLPKMTVMVPQGSFNGLNYGQLTMGKTLDATIRLINTSDSTISLKLIGATSLSKGKSFSLASGGGAFTLARRDTQTVVVRFAPDSVGMLRDSLVITNNSSTPITKVSLTGQGVAPVSYPKIQFSGLAGGQGNRLSFGQSDTVGVPVVRSFSFKNNSDFQTKLIGSVGNPKNPEFVVTAGGGDYSLDSGLTKIVEVTFTATAAGPMNDTLLITSNDSTRLTFKVALSANGVVPGSGGTDTLPIIRINRTIFDFGNVTQGATEQSIAFAVTNSSTNNKQLTFTLESPGSPFRLSSSGSFSLNQGERKTDTMYFATTTTGNFLDSLVILSNTSEQTKRMVIPVKGNILSGGSSVRESKLITSTSVYPNPASSIAKVQFTVAQEAEISATVYDVSGVAIRHIGSELYSAGSHALEINCSDLSAGMYYLQMVTSDGVKVLPIAVTK
ncbi:MAG TPA: choice-of-anchor D domain-containing protein [Candidatus Kapabacteria bacterium]|nr:choice-of-anchor D domain-containing protein [Candidatus Kapabacteria bacterium]